MESKKEHPVNRDQNTDQFIEESAGNFPSTALPGNATFEHAEDDPNTHKGSKNLIENYNINDKAHADSSKKDFVKTVSNFHHASNDSTDKDKEQNT